jgi:hypothetical protein
MLSWSGPKMNEEKFLKLVRICTIPTFQKYLVTAIDILGL